MYSPGILRVVFAGSLMEVSRMLLPALSPVRLFATPGLYPARLLCPWASPGQNTGVGCHALLQGIFLTQGSKLRLSCLPALAGRVFTISATWEAHLLCGQSTNWIIIILQRVSCRSESSEPHIRLPSRVWHQEEPPEHMVLKASRA